MSRIRMVLELGKYRIALLVALSTLTGYVLAGGSISIHLIIPVTGIYFLALGSGALNQYQEREKDALMPRTSGRPLPAGMLSPASAALIAFSLMVFGTIILLVGTNLTAVVLGLLTVLWYNGLYTYLKRITPLAVIPGSVIGALPPLVGWATVNENIFQIQPLILALFFFIWQIPHFWLLLLNFGPDYEKAGYPSLTAILDDLQLGRLTFIWIVATAFSIILMPLFGLGNSNIIYFLLFTASTV
ncbi:MAG: protoheme IX farnesyltransferase, partial [Calditrichia bacterium]|nr:protoheme IX farnesyltransferase [Calditrichia bacterium]